MTDLHGLRSAVRRPRTKAAGMTRDEERAAVLAYRAGDARGAGRLLAANEGLLRTLTWRYRRAGHFEELIQEARMGFLLGLRRFDLRRKTKVATYALWWARARVQAYLEHVNRKPVGRVELDDPDEHFELAGPALDPVTAMDNRRVHAAVATLGERERYIITRRHLKDECTLDDIGQEWGLSRERVRQLEARALGRLRKVLA